MTRDARTLCWGTHLTTTLIHVAAVASREYKVNVDACTVRA